MPSRCVTPYTITDISRFSCVAWQSRYQELFRVGRQWRNLKQRKWSSGDGPDGPGSLALYCAACPQPKINIPNNWRSDPDPTVYTRSFVMDGNFSAVHQKRQNAVPEKCLTDGDLYLVSDTKYLPYLQSTKECKEVGKQIFLFIQLPSCCRWLPVMNTMLSMISLLHDGARTSLELVPQRVPGMGHFAPAELSISNKEKGVHSLLVMVPSIHDCHKGKRIWIIPYVTASQTATSRT